ncbi:MAG TPA: RHS repeat-associated core domain-containing protein [Fimbriimonadaceae bacterium]|nr:RHS repeat-associated core domain-containing protein [Fimbriimonadaceae bacterium]
MFEDGVKTAYTIGNNNEMTEAGTDDFTYDFYGNAVFINSGGHSYDLAYDYERHLLELYKDEVQVFLAEYDGDGRRMRVQYNQSGVWTNFVHCELTGEILAEYTLVSGTFTIKCLNTYGIGLISSNRESTKRYFHFDGLGNTVVLTDASENITDTYTWTAFGNLLSSTGSSVNPYRYVGQWGYYDDGAMGCPFDMLLLGVRYYVPGYGRFLTWDPVPALNLYDYTRNMPTIAIDPDGEFLHIIAIVVIGVVCISGCSKPPKKMITKCKEWDGYERTPCGDMCKMWRDGRTQDLLLYCKLCCDQLYKGIAARDCALACGPNNRPCICPKAQPYPHTGGI